MNSILLQDSYFSKEKNKVIFFEKWEYQISL